jgi:cytochrome c-type biogenesis protein CcmH/NrfF
MTNPNPHPKLAQHGKKSAQLALLTLAIFALSGAGDPATRFTELGHQLMCICGCNQILLECNHVGCPDSDGMRNELMAGLERGDSDSLVEQAFVQKYGPTVLAAPPTTGAVNRAAWIVPFAALALGFAVVIVVVRGWRNGPPSNPTGGPKLPPAPPTGGASSGKSAEFERFRDQAGKETDL